MDQRTPDHELSDQRVPDQRVPCHSPSDHRTPDQSPVDQRTPFQSLFHCLVGHCGWPVIVIGEPEPRGPSIQCQPPWASTVHAVRAGLPGRRSQFAPLTVIGVP